jgi:hypothetical protein
MAGKNQSSSPSPDWVVDTDEANLKNDGKDYQTDEAANTNHGRSGSSEPSAIYAADKSKQSSDND